MNLSTIISDTPTRPDAKETLVVADAIGLMLGDSVIIKDISLTIPKGEFVCVVGPSGCGKTSLLRILGGLWKPTTGTVRYRQRILTAPQPDIAIVFQDYAKALLPWRTAEGNVSLALEARGVPPGERRDRINALLKLVGLQNQNGKYPNQLSGGMQQRLQMARCLAQEPSLLLMDEPFGALDAMTRQALQDEVLAIVGSTGASVFFVTHDLEEAIYLGDRVIGLLPHPGRIAVTHEVPLDRPRHQLTTRESPEFLHLRRELFAFIRQAES